jgi:hypothetical protein
MLCESDGRTALRGHHKLNILRVACRRRTVSPSSVHSRAPSVVAAGGIR